MTTDARELRDLAAAVAADTGTFLLRAVDDHNVADTKSSATDMVTAADRAAEAQIVEAITAVRPTDGFVGEEGTNRSGTSGVRWIIDPIDGTTNFVFSHPGYGVSIAAELHDEVVAGAVADPVHGHLFAAAKGCGAQCNGEEMRARQTTELPLSLVATGFSFSADRRRRQAEALTIVLPEIADIRRMGSAAIDLCSVGLGRVDAYYEIGLNNWDLAAGALIAAEAGAHVSMHPSIDETALILAAAPGIADDLQALLARTDLLEAQ